MAIDILVVDDEADIRLGLSGILEDEGFCSHSAGRCGGTATSFIGAAKHYFVGYLAAG